MHERQDGRACPGHLVLRPRQHLPVWAVCAVADSDIEVDRRDLRFSRWSLHNLARRAPSGKSSEPCLKRSEIASHDQLEQLLSGRADRRHPTCEWTARSVASRAGAGSAAPRTVLRQPVAGVRATIVSSIQRPSSPQGHSSIWCASTTVLASRSLRSSCLATEETVIAEARYEVGGGWCQRRVCALRGR